MSSLVNKLCFDIETIAKTEHYWDLSKEEQENWEDKCERQYLDEKNKFENDSEVECNWYEGCWQKWAATSPEYSKILCISCAVVVEKDSEQEFKTVTYSGKGIPTDEEELETVENFFKLVHKVFNERNYTHLVGHNIKGFDIPFILKKALMHGISYSKFPFQLQLRDRKPWEMDHILDTKEMYRFGSYFLNATLGETCIALGVESPKDGAVKGSEIYSYIYKEENPIDEVKTYCELDVVSTMKVLEKLL
jgi:hypothetical protein